MTWSGGGQEDVHHTPSYELTLNLETSGKWPWDEGGIRDCLTGFYLEMGRCLSGALLCQPLPDRLLVLSDGFVISVRISEERSLAVLDARLPGTPAAEKAALEARMEELRRQLFARPKLCRYLKKSLSTSTRDWMAWTVGECAAR